ncbi:MAG: DUF732 domain-containing protein [Mycobacterium sp.]|uniref:DUF732 domain-containing protein n=1 Tax=Mycobacterium sp. TaxID=1785 RepID=UPI001EC248E0|nr:DUF732 domain-containing protein [Mycobacterium sp.]MBW0020167.1 DUF732 domain-containing protein [Mycobacterium sp.]
MSPIRWLARLTVPILIGGALCSSTASAVADPVDDLFLAKLAGIGFVWPPDQTPSVVSLGHHICIDRLTGWTADAIAHDVHSIMSAQGFTFEDVTSIVSAAESTYCSY